MSDEIPNTNEIQAYLHCSICIQEKRPQNIEAGWTSLGFQVWCRHHQCNIMHVNFESVKHPANTTRALTAEESERQQRGNSH